MRAIDADELIKTIEKICFSPEWARFRADFGSNGERDYIINEIVNAPTIEERPTGEWVEHSYGLFYERECSNCGSLVTYIEDFGFYSYCPNCGAKMKGEEE